MSHSLIVWTTLQVRNVSGQAAGTGNGYNHYRDYNTNAAPYYYYAPTVPPVAQVQVAPQKVAPAAQAQLASDPEIMTPSVQTQSDW